MKIRKDLPHAFVTRVIVTTEFVTRDENSLYVRQIRFNFSHVK